MILDGKKSPDFTAIDLAQIAFAGNHLLYVAQASDGRHLVIDGTPRQAWGSVKSLRVSPDGGHYAYIAEKSGHKLVVADRKEGLPRRDVQDLMLFDGGQVAYFADGGTLVVGDQEITSEANRLRKRPSDHSNVAARRKRVEPGNLLFPALP